MQDKHRGDIEASNSRSLTQHEPDVLAVFLVAGVSHTEMARLLGYWEGDRVVSMALFDERSKLNCVVLGVRDLTEWRRCSAIIVVHFSCHDDDGSGKTLERVARRLKGLASQFQADAIGAIDLSECEIERCVVFDDKKWWQDLKWDVDEFYYPEELADCATDQDYPVQVLDSLDVPAWVNLFFKRWQRQRLFVALKSSNIGAVHAVDALTHCMTSLDGSGVEFEKKQYRVSVYMVEDLSQSAKFMPFVVEEIKGVCHIKPAGGSTHFLFSNVSQGEFQRAQLQFMLQHSSSQGAALPPGTTMCVLDDDDSRFDNNEKSQVAARFKATVPQQSEPHPGAELVRALEMAANRNELSSDDSTKWAWWRDFVQRYLAQRSTFGMATPLTKGGFIELQLIEFSEKQLKAAASQSAVMLYADGDSSAQCVDNPALSLMDAANELRTHRVLALFGEAGQGKTSTLRQWQQLLADSGELALCVRADLLWQRCRARSPSSTDAFVDALVEAFAASVGESDDMNEEERAMVRALVQERGVALLLDSIDEVPPAERAAPAFEIWLKSLVESVAAAAAPDDASQNARGAAPTRRRLLTRLVLASRYSAQATLLPLRNVRGGSEKMKACCIAPMSDEMERQYVSALLATWKSGADADHVLELSHTIGVRKTPLMLLMLCVLMDDSKLSTSTHNQTSLYGAYEALLKLLHERERNKPNSLLADFDDPEWLFDLYALLGFVCHYVGGAAGSALVRKFDVALLFETFRVKGQLLAPEHEALIRRVRLHRLTDDDTKVTEITLVSWLIETLGTVSASPGEQVLVERIVFGHRTFQEFLAARALVRCLEKAESDDKSAHPLLDQIVVLSGFDWQGGATVANQWWDQVLMFVASARGLKFVIQKVADESVYEWRARLLKHGGTDPTDLGHVRLVLFLRTVLAAPASSDGHVAALRALNDVLYAIATGASASHCLQLLRCVPNAARVFRTIVAGDESGRWGKSATSLSAGQSWRTLGEWIGCVASIDENDVQSKAAIGVAAPADVANVGQSGVVDKLIGMGAVRTIFEEEEDTESLVLKALRFAAEQDWSGFAKAVADLDEDDIIAVNKKESGDSVRLHKVLQNPVCWTLLLGKTWRREDEVLEALVGAIRDGSLEQWTEVFEGLTKSQILDHQHRFWLLSRNVRCLVPCLRQLQPVTIEEKPTLYYGERIFKEKIATAEKVSCV